MLTKVNEVYDLVSLVIEKGQEFNYDDIVQKLDDAMHLGSSGLEILGAIRNAFLADESRISKLVGRNKVQDVIDFVNRSFGAS